MGTGVEAVKSVLRSLGLDWTAKKNPDSRSTDLSCVYKGRPLTVRVSHAYDEDSARTPGTRALLINLRTALEASPGGTLLLSTSGVERIEMQPVPTRNTASARTKYLFAESRSPYEITLALADRLKRELAEISQQSLLELPLEELTNEFIQRYTITVPTLEHNNVSEFEPVEVRLQVPQNSQYGIFSGPGPHFVDATKFQIRIPFAGDPSLFRYSATGFGNLVEGEVVDDAVILTHIAKKPDLEAVKLEFSNRIERIENALQLSKGQVSQWNGGLINQVRPSLERRISSIRQHQSMSLGYQRAAVATPNVQAASSTAAAQTRTVDHDAKFDVFLSHASEDKGAIARPLYEALEAEGVTVWFDEAVLRLGDSLRRKIDDGLARCNFGIVIISPNFFSKEWPQRELDGLAAREVADGKTVILPIWHDIEKGSIVQKSPVLADRLAAKSTEGVPALVRKILQVVRQ